MNSNNLYSISIGFNSGPTKLGDQVISIGTNAGASNQNTGAIAIGYSAGSTAQGTNAIAIGVDAGQSNQSTSAIAIGVGAGQTNQGTYSIAIGYLAGQSAQASNSIILNASGLVLNNTQSNAFIVNPVRNALSSYLSYYNISTNEISYDPTLNIGGVNSTQSVSTSTGALATVNPTTITATNSADMSLISIQQPTLAASSAQTTANASTLYIAGPPRAGMNETITNPWSVNVDSGNARFNGNLVTGDGLVTAPAYSFLNETNMGWYRAGVGDIRLSTSGSDSLTYSGAQFLVNGRQRTTIAGTSSNPSIKIGTDDTNMTGFYNNGFYALTASVGQTAIADFRYTATQQGIRLYGNTTSNVNNALYSPSILGYYEDNTTSMQFSFSPGGQTTASGNVRFIRIGNIVIMQIPSYAVITNNSGGDRAYRSTTTIPLRFQPPYLIMQPITGILNGVNSNTLNIYINSGTIYIERVDQLFNNTNTFSPYGMTMTWVLP
jgi:hypothetical protein